MNTIKVTVFVAHDKDGYVAQADGVASMWSRGKTIDEAIANYKKDYASLSTIQFADGNVDFDFHVILKG